MTALEARGDRLSAELGFDYALEWLTVKLDKPLCLASEARQAAMALVSPAAG
jgi:hypothetical protein